MASVAANSTTFLPQEKHGLTDRDCKSTSTGATQSISLENSYQCDWSVTRDQDDGRRVVRDDNEIRATVVTSHGQYGDGAQRCSNPEPVEPGSYHSHADLLRAHENQKYETASVSTVKLVVPKVVQVSPIHPKALRPNAIMAEAESKRRKEAQIDFPRTNHTISSNNMAPAMQNSHNGSLRNAQNRQHAHQQQQQTMRASPTISQASSTKGKKPSHSLGGASMTSSVSSVNNMHPTPLFQRLVSEEVQELKAYARIIENQNRRLAELERVHGDLEVRLEVQSNRRMELEKTLEDRERIWAEQTRELERDRDSWKDLVNVERAKNGKLMDQVVRKDQDIHRMLQRKVSLL
jgi:hypothetical protein